MVTEWATLDAILAGIILFMSGVIVAIVLSKTSNGKLLAGAGGISAAGIFANFMSLDPVGLIFPFIESIIRTIQAITVIYIPEIFPLDIFGRFAGLLLVAYVMFRMLQAADAASEAAEEIDE